MKNTIVVLSLVFWFGTLGFSQGDYMLSPKTKAYIYHVVRKSPILEQNIGRYIIYTGEEITFPNGAINYDSIEQVIINQPDLLQIYGDEIKRAPKGLLAELANKTAIWELNKALLSFRSSTLSKDGNYSDYQYFKELLIQYLPEKAKQTKKGEIQIVNKIEKLSNPTLTFKDKTAMLDGFSWTVEEKQAVIIAYNKAINEWVGERAFRIFQELGGRADYFNNILTAAGDGSSTSGLFEEREKDERGRWNLGLPKAVGLFPYESYIGVKSNSKREKQEVLSMGYTVHTFETFGKGRETNIHLDVWGYNSEKQTTVVIQKAGYQYPLFGAENTRFLSPDSSFAGGMTYYTLIHRLQVDIDAIEEKISGKRGYDYWIAHYEKLRDEKKLLMDKTEKEISDIRTSPITTQNDKLKTNSHQSVRKKRQEKVVALYGDIKRLESKIADLKAEKKEAVYKKQALVNKRQQMLDLIGERWVPFKEKDGLYIYEDSARFDILTQEFTFPPTEHQEDAEVRLIAMPISHKNEQFDEVMLHINIMDALPDYNSKVRIEMNDIFGVDKYQLPTNSLFQEKDSIGVKEFFENVLDKKKSIEIIARGGGVGKVLNHKIVSDYEVVEIAKYPGSDDNEQHISKESAEFKKLRSTEVLIKSNREITVEVNSYTDPVRSNFKPKSAKMLAFMQKNNLSGNQLLSCYRTYTVLKTLKSELNVLASEYLSKEESSIVIDRINKAIDKSKINVGKTSVKFKNFEE